MPSVLQKAAAHLLLPSPPAVLPGAGLEAGGSGQQTGEGRTDLLRSAAGLACAVGGLQAFSPRERGLQWNAWFCQEVFLYLLLWRGVGWLSFFVVCFFLLLLFLFLPLRPCFDLS